MLSPHQRYEGPHCCNRESISVACFQSQWEACRLDHPIPRLALDALLPLVSQLFSQARPMTACCGKRFRATRFNKPLKTLQTFYLIPQFPVSFQKQGQRCPWSPVHPSQGGCYFCSLPSWPLVAQMSRYCIQILEHPSACSC